MKEEGFSPSVAVACFLHSCRRRLLLCATPRLGGRRKDSLLLSPSLASPTRAAIVPFFASRRGQEESWKGSHSGLDGQGRVALIRRRIGSDLFASALPLLLICHYFSARSTSIQGKMDVIDSAVDPLREFAKDSVRLVMRCHKPDRKEFTKVAFRTAIGFVVMGFVGFFVKLIFIPINNIIVGSG
ncbi:hypothetical protein Taro_016083 [Colocasia esculenta]|uniref:Protein transport protein Sec61 subunit gamma n=2 Tax=Magnoliopsida TaxID=3398 RepID=A0A843UD13_COLES|nr:hypothetical protein [Colocasia esculenta]